jgi:hypothetical protein
MQITVGKMDLNQGGDDDDVFLAMRRQDGDMPKVVSAPATAKKHKVVKF